MANSIPYNAIITQYKCKPDSIRHNNNTIQVQARLIMFLQCVRTESSALSSSPEFLARTFVLRLAQPLANTLAPQALLQVNLYAAPSIDSPNGEHRKLQAHTSGNTQNHTIFTVHSFV